MLYVLRGSAPIVVLNLKKQFEILRYTVLLFAVLPREDREDLMCVQ